MGFHLFGRDVHVPAKIPKPALVASTLLSMATIAVLAVCLIRRIQATRNWGRIPVTRWLLFAIYVDSIAFIIITSVLEHGFGLNLNQTICSTAILLCLVCYMSTKLIYYFLVEKVYIIRRVSTPRLKSKLYCFNCFGMLLPYCVVIALNFVYRTAYFDAEGTCIIGMQAKAMMPLIIFDAVVNFYLTMLFVLPLRSLYSYKNSPNSMLRTIALRSFVGSLGTLTSSVVNLTVLMVLKGEAAWICLMCCNADILFSVLVLHWVTSKDSSSASSTAHTNSAVITNKLERFGYGTGSASGRKTGVTTHISAVRPGKEDEEEIQRVDWGVVKSDDGKAFPMGRIEVRVGHVVEVVREGKPGLGVANGRGSVASTTNEDASRARSHLSTEELVERPL